MDTVVSVTLTRSRALVLALVLLALLVVAGRRLAGAGAASQPPAAGRLEPIAAAPAPVSRIVVHVVGAVRRPGLYRLRDGSRIADALAKAGGAVPKADLAAVNLAAPLADGSQVLVPRGAATGGAEASPSPGGSPASPVKVSLASATLEQLDALPGIGPVTAQKILDYRAQHGPIRSADDLDAVPGIGPARVEQLRELVTP
jgi:competence protein ComEA